MPSAEGDHGHSDRQERHWHDHALVWATVAAAIGAASAAGVNAYQAYLMRENNVVSQRAFVYVQAFGIINAIDAKDNVTKTVGIVVPMSNSGNTPTKGLTFFIRCAPSTEALPEPWVLLYRGSVEQLPQVIGPHDSATSICGFTLEQAKQVKDGKLHAYVMGDIIYYDRLNPSTLHRTQFSREIKDFNFNPADGLVVHVTQSNVGLHNCADEDCPK